VLERLVQPDPRRWVSTSDGGEMTLTITADNLYAHPDQREPPEPQRTLMTRRIRIDFGWVLGLKGIVHPLFIFHHRAMVDQVGAEISATGRGVPSLILAARPAAVRRPLSALTSLAWCDFQTAPSR
jgi:hypothetical protein